MSYRYWNPNPNRQNNNGDCVIRAISKVMRRSWNQVYIDLCIQGYVQKDWGNSNSVWDSYLRDNGFIRKVIPNTCPKCYTVKDFCRDNPIGEYILAMGDHVVAVVDGNYYDSYDSGNEAVIFYYV